MFKELSGWKRSITLEYLLKERGFVRKIKLGNYDEDLKDFHELLLDIFKGEEQNIESTKVRVLELILVLSRVVVDRDATFERISKLNAGFIKDMGQFTTFEELCIAAREILQSFLELKTVKKTQVEEITERVQKYILQNYYLDLSLEDIAKTVYLSPFYLSHLFKEVQGITVMGYVTQVRLEKAKELLHESNYSIYEIAQKLGYKEPGYFSKVFRRKEGRTPTQFRQLG